MAKTPNFMDSILKRSPGGAPSPSRIAADVIARLEDRREQASRVFQTARDALGRAVLAAEEGEEGATAALEKARRQLENSERALVEADVSLVTARSRHEEAVKAEAAKERKAQWDALDKAAARKTKAAVELHRQSAAFGAAWQEWVDSSNAMNAAIPPKTSRPDLVDAVTRSYSKEALVRSDLRAAGVRWASDADPSLIRPQNFVADIEQECEALKALRDA